MQGFLIALAVFYAARLIANLINVGSAPKTKLYTRKDFIIFSGISGILLFFTLNAALRWA